MKTRLWLSAVLATALAACGQPAQQPAPQDHAAPPAVGAVDDHTHGDAAVTDVPMDQEVYPAGNPFRLLAIEELPITAITVDSEASGFTKDRLADGDLSSQWASGHYQAATAWAAVQLAASAALGSIEVKMPPSKAGTSYDVQVSSDGVNWTTALSGQTNTSWNLEKKLLPAGTTGKFVRLFWHNAATNPDSRFTVFELVVNGEGTGAGTGPAPAPSPTPTPTSSASPVPVGTRLTAIAATASSTYTGLPAERAIDGSLSTQWANGGYKEPECWLQLEFPQVVSFGQAKIKTGALPTGVTFKFDTSVDGVNWSPASGRITNLTWGMEAKDLVGQGKYLRVRFLNSQMDPIARFQVYELEAYAGSGSSEVTSPAPTATPTPSGSPTPSTTGKYPQYYPDWTAVPPTNAWIENTSDGHKNLRFGTAIVNGGPGHIQIRGVVEGDVTRGYQQILDPNNHVVQEQDVGTFEYHPTHGHFHITDVSRYELRQGTYAGPIVRTAAKVSFCVEDSFKYYPSNETARYPDCSSMLMGITRSWADHYTANLPDQDFDITTLPAGEYTIVIYIDPTQKFLDASRGNNMAWQRLYVDPAASRVLVRESSQ